MRSSFESVKGDGLEEEVGEFGVRWSPACEDVSPEAEERPPFEAVTKQRD
jgi:hypothetical protein